MRNIVIAVLVGFMSLMQASVCIAEEVKSKEKILNKQQIEEVLDRPEFGKTKKVTGWRQKDRKDKEKREELFPEWLIDFFEFLEVNKKGVQQVSILLEVLLWLAVGAIIFWIIYRYREQISEFVQSLSDTQQETELPTTLFGLDVKNKSLPKDVIGEAKQAWQQGDSRTAMSVLLRASLIKLLYEYDCHFKDSDTEAECCLRIDKQTDKSMASFMRSLVTVWQQLAYAHKKPSNDIFEQLCQRWQEVF